MEVLKFELSGKHAMFKKPEVNSYYYFSYGNIHKVALLGIFGAVLGYSGYGKAMEGKNGKITFGEAKGLPEFYKRLREIKVGIEPLSEKGYIPKKIQTFNNSVGYASKELGGNLIIKEQWLENPRWNIYLLLDGEESEKIADSIQKQNSIFLPYLGKNDHFADIQKAEIFSAEPKEEVGNIHTLFQKSMVQFGILEDAEEDEDEYEETIYKYVEALPLGIKEETRMYETETFLFTNAKIKNYKGLLYEVNKKNIAFY